ncbi:MAG: AAA family ATPase [FCB group bacterium]|jgi:predicted ATPase|nr:AAA family ATPase [FCB group bacterium]
MTIDRCHIENFTVFEDQHIEFCKGVNIVIGANGTGKSHLLKLLYAMTQWMTGEKHSTEIEREQWKPHSLINGLFKPEGGDIGLLLRKRTGNHISEISVEFGSQHNSLAIRPDSRGQTYDSSIIAHLPNAKGLFVPPNEVLAIYPGFVASYEKRELAFDQTYYDICKALAAAPLKTNAILSRLKNNLEGILQGSVIQKGDRFYVQSEKSARTLEAHLLAEGHRKIAALIHLINNGSISKDTILFWDEPEANLNPRLIKHVANLLRDLAKIGVQVFISTHDYLLTGELSLAAEYRTQPRVPIRFFAMSRNEDGPVDVQSGETLADLTDNPILDEFAEHYQREQDAVASYMKERGHAE